MSVEVDNLKAQVERIKGVKASVIATLSGLSKYIADHKDDPAALQALADDLKAQGDDFAAAVEANPVPA